MTGDAPLVAEQIQWLHETSKDETLQDLADVIKMGWPDKKCEVSPCLRQYFNIHKMFLDHGVIFKIQSLLSQHHYAMRCQGKSMTATWS